LEAQQSMLGTGGHARDRRAYCAAECSTCWMK
jgi:hypothetical protein